jgi:hypothetical protein
MSTITFMRPAAMDASDRPGAFRIISEPRIPPRRTGRKTIPVMMCAPSCILFSIVATLDIRPNIRGAGFVDSSTRFERSPINEAMKRFANGVSNVDCSFPTGLGLHITGKMITCMTMPRILIPPKDADPSKNECNGALCNEEHRLCDYGRRDSPKCLCRSKVFIPGGAAGE